MLALLLSSLPILAAAHNAHHAHYGRQAQPPPLSAIPTGTTVSASGSRSGSATVSGASATFSAPPIVSVSIISEAPGATPLSDIVADALATSTPPAATFFTTFAAGSVPSAIPNAPPLPDLSSFSCYAQYPTLDKTPPTDSPQVQAWIQEVQNSGVSIPDFSPTNGSAACSANPEAVADTSRCWWTCQSNCINQNDVNYCPKPGTMGLTSDDGPGPNSLDLVQYLEQQNLKDYFFEIGSRLCERPNVTQVEYMLGHSIGVHTWSHPPLTTLTNEQIIGELGWSRKIIKDVTGVTALYFRPPYGDIDNRVRAIALGMNLKPVIWTRENATFTFDTGDWEVPGGSLSSEFVINNYDNILEAARTLSTGYILLEHDLWWQTEDLARGYIIPSTLASGVEILSVTDCLGLQPGDIYLETNNNASNPLPLANATAAVVVTSTAISAKTTSSSADISLIFSTDSRRSLFNFVVGALSVLACMGSVGLLL